MAKSLALFDFDGTITTRDSLADFIQFAVGKPRYYLGLLRMSPVLAGFVFKLIRNDVAKQKLLGHFFGGWTEQRFQRVADDYAASCIEAIVRPKAMARINWHKAQGHQVVIVSASAENWLRHWCDKHGLDLLGTKMESRDGLMTGRFVGNNCHGEEKVRRVSEVFAGRLDDIGWAYGDTSGDRPMLSMAKEGFYRHFE